jgi:predicted enzyme related to lactoylglutathione lyase
MAPCEFYADDPQRVMAFYAAVFRWSFLRRRASDSWWVSCGPITAPQIDGVLKKRVAGERGHLGALAVSAFDVTVERIRSHGGRIITPISAGMRSERQIYAIDPEGNSFRLLELVTMPVALPILSLPVPMRVVSSYAVTA